MGEYYATGYSNGINMFFDNIQFQGAIWVVNVSQDIEQIWRSKNILHDLIFSQEALSGIHLAIVYNKKPDTLKKQSVEDMKGTPKIVFKREEVRSINNAWTECPFEQQ